jgi:hypothetical protein
MSIGYKPFRYSRSGLVPCANPYDYSTMREGGLDVRLIKGDSIFTIGLHEFKKPPTLISPRPRIQIYKTIVVDLVEKDIVINEHDDDAMNVVLKEVECEDIFKAIHDKSICFHFDLRESFLNMCLQLKN